MPQVPKAHLVQENTEMIADGGFLMKRFITAYYKTLLFFTLVGLFGGFFAGLYLLDSYPAEIKAQLLAEMAAAGLGAVNADLLIALVTAVQSAAYGLLLGAGGILLAKRVGLFRDERTLAKKPLIITALASLLGGLVLILPDLLFFGPRVPAIAASYAAKPSIVYVLASVTYGAVIEEVMLRLFMMSLVAFLLFKLFGKGREAPATWIFVAANLITALLFAACHLPATFIMIGSSPLVLFRCFALNGGFGLLFGYLYRKWGLRYAMLAHGGVHIVSKLIWILFV